MSWKQGRVSVLVMGATAFAGLAMGPGARAQTGSGQATTAARPNFTLPTGGFNTPSVPALPPAKPIGANATVVEDVVARINDQVITRTEYERSQQGLVTEANQEKWSQAELADKQHTLLRDLIDQQLLLSKGKVLGITGDAEVTRQLDEIRKRANLPDMESLEKAAGEQGVSYEDFKQNIRNQVITQQVVRDEVGRHLNITPSQEQAYYQAHAKDFEQAEQVHLSEILVSTPDTATDAQISAAQSKADGLEAKLKAGGDFAQLAKSSSGGPTASAGGDLGDFKRGMLGDVLEKATFALPVGGYTAPIRTRQGFVILKVDAHQQAGTPPLNQVENQVQEGLYMSQLQPALRSYLTQAREDAFVEVRPGFVDIGSGGADSRTKFTAYTPPPVKKKVVKKQRAEQEKAEQAERQLAAAREKVAEKQQAKAAAHGGIQNAGFSRRAKKVKREKVRFGQAPRNALPNGTAEATAVVPSLGAATEGSGDAGKTAAPGASIASATDSVTSISTGTGTGSEGPNPLEAQADTPERKSRFSSRQSESDEKKAQTKLAKAEVKSTKRPEKVAPVQATEEKVQAAPLGLKDAGAAKPKHVKRPKDQPKERLQEKTAPSTPATPEIAPTVNPSLGTSATSDNPTRPASGTSDQSTLPPASAAAPNAPPQGQPIPAVTGTQPNAPTTTVPQPQ